MMRVSPLCLHNHLLFCFISSSSVWFLCLSKDFNYLPPLRDEDATLVIVYDRCYDFYLFHQFYDYYLLSLLRSPLTKVSATSLLAVHNRTKFSGLFS